MLFPSDPSHFTLLCLLNIIDSFKDIGNVVESPLLDIKHISCKIQIYSSILTPFDKLNKFLCDHGQGIFLLALYSLVLAFIVLT